MTIGRVVAAIAAGLAAAALAGCSSGRHSSATHAALVWQGMPQVFRPPDLPRDRVLIGRVRNASGRTLHLRAAKVVIRDAGGHALRSSAAFTATYAHGLFGAFQQPSKLPQPEVARLGRDIYLTPKSSAPFYAAWRLSPGSRLPVAIDYAYGALTAPETVKAGAR